MQFDSDSILAWTCSREMSLPMESSEGTKCNAADVEAE